MRICLLTASVLPTGGIAAMVRLLANGLAAGGHQVRVLHCDGGASPAGYHRDVEVRQVTDAVTAAYGEREAHGSAYRGYWRLRSLANPAVLQELETLLDDFSPAVIHTHESRGFPLRLWPVLKQRVPAPIVHTCHDIELLSPVHSASLDARNPIERWVLHRWSRLYRGPTAAVDALITPSRFLQDRLAAADLFRNAERHVLVNAAPAPAHPAPLQAPAETEALRIAFLGRLVPLKGVVALCEAVAGMTGGGRACELRIAGDGPLRGRVRDLCRIHEGMAYLGEVTGTDKSGLFEWTHLVAVPTNGEESFGLVAAEAMAAGRPVLASGRGGLPEIVADGVTGWIVPDPVRRGLLAGLERAWRERRELPDYSRRCLERAVRFAPQRYIAGHEAIYSALAR